MNVGHPRLFHRDGFLGGAGAFRPFLGFDASALRILRLEEDASDSRHATSVRPRGHAPEWVSGTKAVPPSRRSGLAIPAAQPAALRSEKIRRYSRRYRVMRKFLRTRSRPAFPIVFRFAGSRRSWIVRSAHSLTLDTR